MRAALYLRQSLAKDGDELGVERQLAECQALCDRRGYDVAEVISDNNVSASRGVRPGYRQLLGLIERQEVDVVVVLRIDRLLRKLTDLEALIDLVERTNVAIASVQGDIDLSNSQGRLLGRILASVARAEVETKGERQRLANAQRAAQGKPHGSRRPYGYETDLVTIYEPEAEVLRQMAARVIDGWNYKEVAAWANRQGYVTTQGRPFIPVTVRNMLLKKRYAGIRDYKGSEYPGAWDAVFDADTWAQLQLVMRLRSGNNVPKLRKYLLTGLLYCGHCGERLNGVVKRDRPDSPKRRTYQCVSCRKLRRNAEALEHFIAECVLYRLETPELAGLLSSDRPDDVALSALLDDRRRQQLRLDGLVDDYATGLLNKEQLTRAKASAEGELRRIEADINRLQRERQAANVPVGKTLREAWETAESDAWRRSLLDLLIKKVTVNPGNTKPFYVANGKRMRFDPSLVDIDWRA